MSSRVAVGAGRGTRQGEPRGAAALAGLCRWGPAGARLTPLATSQPLFPGGPGAGRFLGGTVKAPPGKAGSACPDFRGVPRWPCPRCVPGLGTPSGDGTGGRGGFSPPCPSPAGFGRDGKSEPAGPAAAAPLMRGWERKGERRLHLRAAPRDTGAGTATGSGQRGQRGTQSRVRSALAEI